VLALGEIRTLAMISPVSPHTSRGSDRTRKGLGSPLVDVFEGRLHTLAAQENESTTMAESGRGIVSKPKGKYSVELFREGGKGAGQEEIVDRHENLTVARAIYRGRVSQYPNRLVMLRDRARILARSDRPETMP
jgi:hypothetical protein